MELIPIKTHFALNLMELAIIAKSNDRIVNDVDLF